MRFRTGTRETASESGGEGGNRAATSVSRFVRYVVVGLGVVAVAYAASRYLDSEGETGPDLEAPWSSDDDEPREPQEIRIDEPRSTGTEAESTSETGSASSGADAIDDRTNAEFTDEERSADEISERAESDVQGEPAEPGEMRVDEELADDLVDDAEADAEGTSDDERGDDENGSEDDER